jgi:hypothetical protein
MFQMFPHLTTLAPEVKKLVENNLATENDSFVCQIVQSMLLSHSPPHGQTRHLQT